MIVSGGSLDGFAIHSYAAEDQETPAASQEQDVPEENIADPAEEEAVDTEAPDEAADIDAADVVKEEPAKSESSDSKADAKSMDKPDAKAKDDAEDNIYELSVKFEMSDDSKWKVTAVYDDEADIPEGAKLSIEEVDTPNQDAYLDETAKALKWAENEQASYARFLNISIISKGKTVKPAAEVEITITAEDVDKDDLKKMQVVRFDNKKSDAEAKELECEVTKDEEIVFLTDEFADFGFVVSKDSMDSAEGEDESAAVDSDLVHKTLKADKVRLEGMMPEDAKATAKDASDSKAVKKIESTDGTALAAYDIEIKAEGEEYQPDTEHPITVQISNTAIKEESDLSVWHIGDNGKKEEIKDFTVSNGKVSFEATGFSVYVVIDHEEGTVVTPRVQFHFIDPDATEHGAGSDIYYEADPYSFRNKSEDTTQNTQTTQILKDGESLEMIEDPGNITDPEEKDFYGWYVVDPYGNGSSNSDKLYYTWPDNPDKITFKSPISIEEKNVEIGSVVHWSLHDISGSGKVDKDGNVHVYLAPLFDNYMFVNFMLYPRNDNGGSSSQQKNVMTRKLVAMGGTNSAEVKISDVQSNSTDSVHLIFTGWEYYTGTNWEKYQTVDYSGAEIETSISVGPPTTPGECIDLYPRFIEARWVDFVSGVSGSGASFVGSRFLEAWPDEQSEQPEPVDGKNVFESLEKPTRHGYKFDGWYAFAVTDPNTGEITNLTTPADVTVSYIDSNYEKQTDTVNTTAIKITKNDGTIAYNGTYSINGQKLFGADDGKLKFYNGLDRLTLYANWTPDNSEITVVYWTENADNDEYSSSAVKTITTDELNKQLHTNYASGSVITRDGLSDYEDDSIVNNPMGVLERQYLDVVGAVPQGEGKFYDLNEELSDEQVIIKGDGSTIFNVYYSRKIFKLVFHIGRDGYVKNGGHQRTDYLWDGNWIEFMYKDSWVTNELHYPKPEATTGRNPSPSIKGLFSMTYIPDGKTYTSQYVTNLRNVMGDYLPFNAGNTAEENSNDENLYVIKDKYGAYIGDRWPTPTNPKFSFVDASGNKTMYIWAAYYGSLYCKIANDRATSDSDNGANPDINGVYSYMSAELCSNRDGTDIINDSQVHHLVAYYGDKTNNDRYKQYHILYEAMDGTYDPNTITPVPGTDYERYPLTTWSEKNTSGNKTEIIGHEFFELQQESPKPIISNLAPKYQLSEALDGYDLVYSCYDPTQHANPTTGHNDFHIYFFYTPKKYSLTFKYENPQDVKTDEYYYTQSLADANKYEPPQKEGYKFLGWYTNEAGAGEPFDFENTTMPCNNIVLYPVFEKLNYVIKIDPAGGEIDRWHSWSTSKNASTGFRADYQETVSEYNFLERNYIETDEAEINSLGLNPATEVYYYMNAQYISEEHDGNFIPAELRNALYLTASGIDDYWAYYDTFTEEDFAKRGATKFTNKDEWMDAYFGGHELGSLQKYRKCRGAEHYSFMGWHQVHKDGTVSSTPFDFNTLVTENIEIRAMWRLDGGYYLLYNPQYTANTGTGGGTVINGQLEQWTDPQDPTSQLYADQSITHVLRAPTGVTQGWVFRGWFVSDADGKAIQLDSDHNPIYYQPGDIFMVDSHYVTENLQDNPGGIIHMQAYYEPENQTYRKPKVTNLVLDSNDEYGGYVNTTDSTRLPPLPGPGSTKINDDTATWYQGYPTQILLGDIQSNLALHLYRYATEEKYSGIEGKNFFTNSDGYLLLGFDGNKDPESPETGKAYIPTYASDSVASITRKDRKTLYAMWEPMVYATFVNTTDKPITVVLSGDGTDTVSIVNQVTGEFDRKQTTNTITIPAKSGDKNGEVKVVFPKAKAGTDSITAEATNDHIGTKMTVGGEYKDIVPYGIGSSAIPYNGVVSYTGTLQQDKEGIIVTYSEIPDRKVIFDVNDGTWTEMSENYVDQGDGLYAIDENKIVDNNYKPADPTRNGKVFLGWTTNADIAAHTDFSSTEAVTWGDTTITPDAGSNVLDKIKDEYLWDFSQEPPFDQILYAVWSNAVTVSFNVAFSQNLSTTPLKLHQWEGPDTADANVPYVFYRSGDDQPYITYTLAKGDKVPKPSDPSPVAEKSNWGFLKWLTLTGSTDACRYTQKSASDDVVIDNTYDFSQRVTSDITLVTSWSQNKPQHYTFIVENKVVSGTADAEFDYEIAVSDELVNGKINNKSKNDIGPPNSKWGSVTTSLKNNQQYKVLVTVSYITNWGGAYSIGIDVVDRDGIVVKSGQVVYCTYNTYKNFVSDLKYTLTITQQENPEATFVSVETKDKVGGDEFTFNTSDQTKSFTFHSSMGTNSAFQPTENVYRAGENNKVTIVFKNTTPDVAPTGVKAIFGPFVWMLLLGLCLWTAMAYIRRRRSIEAFAMRNDD